MTPKQLRDTATHYLTMFCTPMDSQTLEELETCDNLDELEELRSGLSAGEFDAAEAILENR